MPYHVDSMDAAPNRKSPLLFERFPGLRGKIPWTPLGTFPTPVERMARLGQRIGHDRLFVKRDDLSAELYGGNKVRKLEFSLADVLLRKRSPIITAGAVGSNHVLATTIHAQRLGLETIGVFMPQPVQEKLRANLLCNCHQGCRIEYSPTENGVLLLALRVYLREWRRNRRRPYLLWIGGSSTLGGLGYVEAALELERQVQDGLMPAPDYIFVPVGSCGTMAGLIAGLALTELSAKAVGVRVAPKAFANERVAAFMANRTLARLRAADPTVPKRKLGADQVLILHDYYGDAYAQYTPAGVDAIELIRETEGIALEGTYSGKALAGFLDFMRPKARRDKVALFIDTYNSRPLDRLLEGCPGPELLPPSLQEYFQKDVAPLCP